MKYLSKIIEYGLYLLALILPWQTRWIISAGELEYTTYSLYGTDILLVLILLLFVVREIASPRMREARNDKKLWLISGLVAMSFISIFFAIDKLLALYKFGWLALGAGLFWLIARAAYSRVKLVWSLLAGMAIQALLAVWQFLTQSSLASKWLGLAARRASEPGAAAVETMGADGIGERWLRAYGSLDHPNVLGGVLAVGALLLISGNIKIQNSKIIFWVMLILFSAALFFSFSRAAWLALGLGLAALLANAARKKDLRAQKNILEAVLISGLTFLILFYLYPNLVMTRLYAGGRLENKSRSERIASIKYALPVVKKNWAAGAGPGNYTLALKRELPGRASYFYQPVHNVYLLVFSEIGILGFILFIFLILYFLDALVNPAVAVALVVLLFFDHWLWSLHFGVLFFWLAAGLLKRQDCG